MRIKNSDIKKCLNEIEDFLLDDYKRSKKEIKRDWRTYEQKLMLRIKNAIKSLNPLIEEVIKTIQVEKVKGRKPTLDLKQKILLLLLKHLFDKSNRLMSGMLSIFSLLNDVDVSYKTIERLYSDVKVKIVLHNLYLLILKKKGIKESDASGDGTGYSLSIKKHYYTETQKRKNKAKKNDDKKAFVYSFNIMDLKTRMYIGYGTSLKSERQAYNQAINNLKKTNIKINTLRLDRYYSNQKTVDEWKNTKVYIIPKKNATLNGSWKWKNTMREFTTNTPNYLGEYFKRSNSETGFSTDKRRTGWKIQQRKPDRIKTANTCTTLWHNLFRLH